MRLGKTPTTSEPAGVDVGAAASHDAQHITTKIKTCPLCRQEHAGSCHFATTNAWRLFEAGLAKAGSSKELARMIGIAPENLSRQKASALSRGASGSKAPVLTLSDQVRFNLVQYILDKPVHVPPAAQGARPRVGASKFVVLLPEDVNARLDALAPRHGGASAIISYAFNRWMTLYACEPRSTWPMHGDGKTGHARSVGISPAITEAFDRAIGGPGWRRFYAPVAIEEYVVELAEQASANAAE